MDQNGDYGVELVSCTITGRGIMLVSSLENDITANVTDDNGVEILLTAGSAKNQVTRIRGGASRSRRTGSAYGCRACCRGDADLAGRPAAARLRLAVAVHLRPP